MRIALRKNATLGAAAALVMLVAFGTTASAIVNECAADKQKCVNKKVSAILKCYAKAEATPEKGGQVLTDCVNKAKATFDGGTKGFAGSCFGKLETKFPGGCLTTGDLAALEAKVDAYVDDVEAELNPGSDPPIVNPCQSRKTNCVRSTTAALLKCHQTLDPASDGQVFTDCVNKANTKFDEGPFGGSCFGKFERKFPGACLTTRDFAALEAKVDAFVNDVSCALGVPGLCGNGILDAGEQCDDGNLVNSDGCDANCTFPRCGNGIRTDSEECDDGNLVNGDGCDENCTLPRCGNGIVDAGEVCDSAELFTDCPTGNCAFDCTCGPLLCCTLGCMAVSPFDMVSSACAHIGFNVVPCSTCAGLRGDCCVLPSLSFCVDLAPTECADMGGTALPCADCGCCTDGSTCGQASSLGCPGDTTSIGCGVCWQ